MPIRIWAYLAALVAVGCSSKPAPAPPKGQIVVALTIDWEGAYLSPDGLDALDEFRRALGSAPSAPATPSAPAAPSAPLGPPVPLTHFISAAYFTKDHPDPKVVATITQAVQSGDELALHLHAWRSLAKASGIEPKLSPSFLTGTDKLLEFEDGDVGFDVDLDAYMVPELRALVRTSRRLLEQTKIRISKTFRAGGYLGTPKVLQAIREEGFVADCSAADYRQLDELKNEVLPKRIKEIWPSVDTTSQPWLVDARGGSLLEMPIAAFADYATADEMVAVFEAAHARLRKEPGRDVFVVLGFHQETANDFSGRLKEAIQKVRGRPELADGLVFTTVESAAERGRSAVTPK